MTKNRKRVDENDQIYSRAERKGATKTKNSITCCTQNSLIGLGLKYTEIPKSLKAKIMQREKRFP